MNQYTFKITNGEAVAVIRLSEGYSLYELAENLIDVIGFDFDHAFGFYTNLDGPYPRKGELGEHYTLFADQGGDEYGAGSVNDTKIEQVYHAGKKTLFHFDYGDDWQFLVTCTEVEESNAKRKTHKRISVQGEFPEQYEYPDDEE
jgi:hypothetical protein